MLSLHMFAFKMNPLSTDPTVVKSMIGELLIFALPHIYNGKETPL